MIEITSILWQGRVQGGINGFPATRLISYMAPQKFAPALLSSDRPSIPHFDVVLLRYCAIQLDDDVFAVVKHQSKAPRKEFSSQYNSMYDGALIKTAAIEQFMIIIYKEIGCVNTRRTEAYSLQKQGHTCKAEEVYTLTERASTCKGK